MALDAVGLQQPLRYTVDLKEGLVQQPMSCQLMKGDKKANRVIVRITNGSETVDLSGVGVSGSFIRPPDEEELTLAGNANGNEAVIVLDDLCYAEEGYCEIDVKLTVSGVSRTILALTGYVLAKGNGAYIDVGNVIPNIDDIIAQYAEMKAVTERTLAAAQRAEALAINASGYAGDSNKLGGQPPSYYATAEQANQLSQQMVNYRTAVNLLDNSDFRQPVNQRGTFSAMDSKPLIDRWKSFNSYATIEIDNEGSTITGRIVQHILVSKFKNATEYTVAIYYSDGTTVQGHGVVDMAQSTPHDFIHCGDEILQLSFRGDSETFDFTFKPQKKVRGVALYEGAYTDETLPPYRPKGYAVELAECRMYWKHLPKVLLFTKGNEQWLDAYQHFEPMRVIPTPKVTAAELNAASLNVDGMTVYCDGRNDSIASISDDNAQFGTAAMQRVIIDIDLDADL